jgi:transcriptional regulator with XRE-family HTH domain
VQKNLKKIFGQRVRSLRKARELTQEQLAQAVGVDYKHIGAIERGVRAPSFDVIERLARFLKVQHYQLFLPAEAENIDIEAELRAVTAEMGKAKRATLERVLQELLRMAKKINVS